MKNIVIANSKGGVSKTHLCIFLSSSFSRLLEDKKDFGSFKVKSLLGFDFDYDQLNFYIFMNWRKKSNIGFFDVVASDYDIETFKGLDKYDKALNYLNSDNNTINIVDTKGQLTLYEKPILHCADLVIVPCSNSIIHIDITKNYINKLESANIPYMVALNNIVINKNQRQLSVEKVKEMLGTDKIFDTVLYRRDSYTNFYDKNNNGYYGLTDYDRSLSVAGLRVLSNEVDSLRDEIISKLNIKDAIDKIINQ